MTTPAVPPDGHRGDKSQVRLYVAGDGPNSQSAIAALRALLVEFAGHRIEVEIVDVLTDPERALRDGVLVTPLLMKLAPLPQRRMLGRLSDRQSLLRLLDLEVAPHA
jgi:circadian clock protein KaiB